MQTLLHIISTYTKYDGSPTAHADVLKTLKAHGYKYDFSTPWCVLQIMAAFAENVDERTVTC